ncbi:PAS domain-containing protein [Geitlerinema sp. CS-897]|nr:PAS domain-containing protein [Geitlerinema sp. CS-897]
MSRAFADFYLFYLLNWMRESDRTSIETTVDCLVDRVKSASNLAKIHQNILETQLRDCSSPQESLDIVSRAGQFYQLVLQAWEHRIDLDRSPFWQQLVEGCNELICLKDLDDRLLYINPNLETLLGYPPEAGRDCLSPDSIHPDDRDRVTRYFEACARSSPNERSLEYRLRHRDGSWRHVESIARDLRNEPHIGRIVVCTRDLHDRKQTELALEEQVRFNTLVARISNSFLNLSPDAVDGAIATALERIAQFFGLQMAGLFQLEDDRTPSDVRQRQHLQRTHSWVAEGLEAQRDRVFPPTLDAEAFVTGTLQSPEHCPPDRPIARPISIPLRNSKIFGWLAFASIDASEDRLQDRSDRLQFVGEILSSLLLRCRSERNLQRERAMFQELADGIDAVMWVFDLKHHRNLYVNSTNYQRIWGRSIAGLYDDATQFFQTIHPDDRQQVESALTPDRLSELKKIEYRILRPDGEVRWICARGFPVRHDNGEIERVVGIAEDVTERRQICADLEAVRERYQLAVEGTGDGLWDWDILQDIAHVSPRYWEIYGEPRQAFLENAYAWAFERVHPDDRDRFARAVRDCCDRELPYHVEYRIQHTSGRWVWVQSRAQVVRDENGIPIRMVGSITDISARKRAETALLDSEARLQFLLGVSPAILYCCTPQDPYETRYISENVRFYLGYDPEEILGDRHFHDRHLHPDDRAEVFACLPNLFQLDFHVCEYRFRHKDGTYRWLYDRMRLIRDEDGNPTQIVGSFIDITDRKVAELALQNSEEKFRQIAENNRIVLFVKSADSPQIDYVNAAYETLWGQSRQDLYDDPQQWIEAVVPSDRAKVLQVMNAHFTPDSPSNGEYRIRRSDGQLRWIYTWTFPIPDADGKLYRVAGFAEDITDRKRIEASLARNNAELETRVRLRTLELERFQEQLRQQQRDTQSLVDNSPDVICRFDRQLRHVFVNATLLEISGWPLERFLGKTIEELGFAPEKMSSFAEHLHQVLETGESVEFECDWPTRNGLRAYETRLVPEFDETGTLSTILELSCDITEKNETEQALREREHSLRLALDIAHLGLWEVDFRTGSLAWSQRTCDIFGTTQDCAPTTEAQFYQWVHPDDCDRVGRAVERTMREHVEFDEQMRIFHADGALRWIHSLGRFVRDDDRGDRLLGITMDITARKTAEIALRQSEHRFQSLVANVPGAIYQYVVRQPFLNADGRLNDELTYLCDDYRTLFEIDPEAVLRDSSLFWSLIHPDDLEGFTASVWESLENLTPWQFEYRIITPTGHLRWIHSISSPQLQDNGDVVWDGISFDISDRKLAQQALEDSRHFIERIADTSPNVLYIFDLEQRRNVYVNHAIERYLGYTPNEVQALGDRLLEALIHPDDLGAYFDRLQQIAATPDSTVFDFEYRLQHKNGLWRWFLARETPFLRGSDSRVRQIIGTAQDITERKLAESRLQNSLAEKEVLLREIHHRVKNNLNVVHSLLNMQARRVEDPTVREALFDSQRRLQAMALIHEKLYRSESLAQVDFAEYLQHLVTTLSQASTLDPQRISVEMETEPIELDIDTAVPCGLIVNELLANAFKHAFPEARSGRVRVELRREEERLLRLTVEDDGIGLPDDALSRTTRSLGMRLVTILADQIDAALEIDSNTGTRFQLQFRVPSP